MAAAVTVRITELESQAIANIVWGFSQLGHYHEAMFDVVAREAPKRISDFRPQEVSNLLIGFARFNHLDPVLLEVCLKSERFSGSVLSPQASPAVS